VFRQASFFERSSVERFDPEGFANRPQGEWRSSGISGAPEIGAGQRVTDEEFAPVRLRKPNGVKESGIERVLWDFQRGSEEAGQEL
jgi:hypothetical protein